jgi:hypothetical protein
MSIAQAHFGALLTMRRSELEIERLLDQLYRGEWSAFDTETTDRSIEVFGVVPNEAAVERLLAEGFSAVREHEHGYEKFTHCDCQLRAPPQRRLVG